MMARKMRDIGVAAGKIFHAEAQRGRCAEREMRDSGVDWIGKIPEGWEVISIKEILRNVTIKDHPEARVLSLYRELGILPKDSRDDNHNVTSEDTAQYKFVRIGNVVINKMKAWQGSIGVSAYEGIVSPAYYVCEFLDNNQSLVFIHFLLRNKKLAQEFERLSTGMRVGQWDLGIDDFLRVKIPLPPLAEQKAIAAYLDEKCAVIDAAIAAARKGIEEYKAWKKSLILEMVTGKLDLKLPLQAQDGPPTAQDKPHSAKKQPRRMKPSGIPWIGDIPEGWEVSRVKNECDNLDYLREPISAENRVNSQALYDYYGASGVIDKIDDYNVDDEVLLIGEDGANLRMRNLPLVYKAKGKFWVNNHAHIIKPKENNNYDFLAYALEAGDYNDFITGSAQPKLSQSNLMAYPLIVPPLAEQKAIADYLDEKCAAIDALVAEKEALIADLEAYKKSLIYETVTGKREVA